MSSNRTVIPWSRLGAEFLVIVVGVLAALGVDQWAQERRDRDLEAEYLERLLEDVRYDLAELAFIRERSETSAHLGQLVLDPIWVRRAPVDSLVAVTYAALMARVPDLSRATFNELVSSGGITLIRSREVREALADYDRSISEVLGLYEIAGYEGSLWTWERLPPEQRVSYESACSAAGADPLRLMIGVCSFDWDIDAEEFRAELLREDVARLVRVTGNRNLASALATVGLIEAARRLETILNTANAAL